MSILPRASPRLLCTATQQKNGHRSEEEAEKPDQNAEEKSQLEEQLKDMTVGVQTDRGSKLSCSDTPDNVIETEFVDHFHAIKVITPDECWDGLQNPSASL